ncbi:hypothetical protein GQ44DRAFT_613279 [Phaeosphaeriaceae sp. PMI808]|nr:hypothetical protein GQ44DRAFT_613279 [Phaeosphaeriaceae sp. PMI808]
MAGPVYEQTLPRLTTDYSAPVAAYEGKHANNPHRDTPYDTQTQYRHSKVPPKATQLSLNDTVSQTPYMVMCTQSHQARNRYTLGAAIFSWLILAGYLVLPNTFTSLQSSKTLSGSKGGQLLQSTVRNVQLLPFAGVLCLIGVAGISRLWYKWRRNYVWLITYIFIPSFSHALIGLLSTLISIFTTQGGHFSITATVTVIVVSVYGGTMLTFALWYSRLLNKIMTPRDREVAQYGEPQNPWIAKDQAT